MKQKIVIKVTMSCEKSRSKAMALAARADGVISVGITGDGKDRLEVVGDGVDSVCLVSCLRRKLGHAELLQVEEVKGNSTPEDKTPEDIAFHDVEHPQPYYCPPGWYCHHRHHPPLLPAMVVCEEQNSCPVM